MKPSGDGLVGGTSGKKLAEQSGSAMKEFSLNEECLVV